jgi:hypothetical protein
MDLDNVYLTFLSHYALETNYEPEGYLRYVEICSCIL